MGGATGPGRSTPVVKGESSLIGLPIASRRRVRRDLKGKTAPMVCASTEPPPAGGSGGKGQQRASAPPIIERFRRVAKMGRDRTRRSTPRPLRCAQRERRNDQNPSEAAACRRSRVTDREGNAVGRQVPPGPAADYNHADSPRLRHYLRSGRNLRAPRVSLSSILARQNRISWRRCPFVDSANTFFKSAWRSTN